MKTFLHWGAGVILALHGLIHLLGFASYLKLMTVPTLPYKTAVLGGRLDLGAAGMSLFGLAWGVAALGFVLVAAAYLFGWLWWRPRATAKSKITLHSRSHQQSVRENQRHPSATASSVCT